MENLLSLNCVVVRLTRISISWVLTSKNILPLNDSCISDCCWQQQKCRYYYYRQIVRSWHYLLSKIPTRKKIMGMSQSVTQIVIRIIVSVLLSVISLYVSTKIWWLPLHMGTTTFFYVTNANILQVEFWLISYPWE